MNHPYPEGTRIEKCKSIPGDGHADGARGTITMSLGQLPQDAPGAREEDRGQWGYFVEWDDLPGLPIGIRGDRIRPLAVPTR